MNTAIDHLRAVLSRCESLDCHEPEVREARQFLDELPTPEVEPAKDLISLAYLFPTLRRLSDQFNGLPGWIGANIERPTLFQDEAARLGKGAYLAAQFICSLQIDGIRFSPMRALGIWDSEHRAAFGEAVHRYIARD